MRTFRYYRAWPNFVPRRYTFSEIRLPIRTSRGQPCDSSARVSPRYDRSIGSSRLPHNRANDLERQLGETNTERQENITVRQITSAVSTPFLFPRNPRKNIAWRIKPYPPPFKQQTNPPRVLNPGETKRRKKRPSINSLFRSPNFSQRYTIDTNWRTRRRKCNILLEE